MEKLILILVMLTSATPSVMAASGLTPKQEMCVTMQMMAEAVGRQALQREDRDVFKTPVYAQLAKDVENTQYRALFKEVLELTQVVLNRGDTPKDAANIVAKVCLKA